VKSPDWSHVANPSRCHFCRSECHLSADELYPEPASLKLAVLTQFPPTDRSRYRDHEEVILGSNSQIHGRMDTIRWWGGSEECWWTDSATAATGAQWYSGGSGSSSGNGGSGSCFEASTSGDSLVLSGTAFWYRINFDFVCVFLFVKGKSDGLVLDIALYNFRIDGWLARANNTIDHSALCGHPLPTWAKNWTRGASYTQHCALDTDRVHPRIGSGRVTGHIYFLPHIFMHYFYHFVFLLLPLNWPGQHRPMCGTRSDNQQWLQVILWVVLRRDSGQQEDNNNNNNKQWQ